MVVGLVGLMAPAAWAGNGFFSITVSPASATENSATTFTFTVTRTVSDNGDCDVNYSIGGTATNGTDYTLNPPGTALNFKNKDTSKTIVATKIGDTVYEPDETITITLTSVNCDGLTPPTSATATILNDDVGVTVANQSQAEGNATNTFNYTITRLGPTTNAVSGTYSVNTPGTGTPGATCTGSTDYVTVAGVAWTIPASSSSTTVPITICGDTTIEPDETFTVTITGSVTVVNSTAIGTITNDDGVSLSVSILDSPDPATQGGNITYTVSVLNGGPQQASNAFALIQLATPQVSWVSNTPSQGTCDGATGSSTVECDFGSINSGSSASVTVVAKAEQPGTVPTLVDVFADQLESNYANNSASTTTTVTGSQANISLSFTDAPDPVVVNNRIVYTAIVSNAGPNTAYGVTFSLPLHASTTFISLSKSQGTCTTPPAGSTGTISCSLHSIASGGQAKLTIRVKATQTGVVSATATIAELNPDPSPGDHSQNATTTVT